MESTDERDDARVVTLEERHLAGCLKLSRSANWNQNEADWRLMLRLGRGWGVTLADGTLAASVIVLPYGGKFAWVSMVLVLPEQRRRGFATQLLKKALAENSASGLASILDATPEGHAVYVREGFGDTWGFRRFSLASLPQKPAPEKEVRRICNFIGEDYMDQMLKYASRPDSARLAGISKSWENLAKPILANNTKKYLTKLTADEIFAVERNALQELQHFGYVLENDLNALRRSAAGQLETTKRIKYYISEKTSAISTGLIALVSDKNAYLRLKKRFLVRAACAAL